MLIEIILLIIILWIYTIFRRPYLTETNISDESPVVPVTSKTETKESSPDASTPVVLCASSIPVATTDQECSKVQIEITDTSAKIDVTPVWFDPIPPPNLSLIRPPPNYDKTLETDRRKINVLANYRSMTKKKSLDFVADPFRGDINDTETLVVVLDQLINQHGMGLNFTNSQHIYDDGDQRIPLDCVRLGDISQILSSENDTKIAKFRLPMDLKYQDVTQTNTLKDFILKFIDAIAKFINCDPQFIRVFGIENTTPRNNNVLVNFGIITRSEVKTKALAEQLQSKVSNRSVLKRETNDILQHIIPNQYEFKLEPVLVHLQLQKSDFEPKYNMEYPQGHAPEGMRGNRPYYFPITWCRHALKVEDKYPHDKKWLGAKNVSGEWIVAYHGTRDIYVKDIVQEGASQSKVKRDAYKQEAIQKVGSKANVNGIYLATHCEKGAAKYAESFSVKNNDGKVIKYKVVFQCRVEPGKYTEHTGPAVDVGKILRVFDEKAIRPYGILLKKEEESVNILSTIIKTPSTFCTLS